MYSGLPSGLLRVERVPAAKVKEPSDIANYMAKHSECIICVRKNFVCLCAYVYVCTCICVRASMYVKLFKHRFCTERKFLAKSAYRVAV